MHIALVAHDSKKADLADWAYYNREKLAPHQLSGTGTTGGLIAETVGLEVHRYNSGPLGGDMQIGGAISEGKLDMLVFFWDPLAPQPHDTDVKALLRIATLCNIPTACNRSTADFLISSPLSTSTYERQQPEHLQQVLEQHR